MKLHDSLATLFAGAELAPTPKPCDPGNKLRDLFALTHPGMVNPTTKEPLVVPPWDEEDLDEEEPEPTP